jgi:hypothetical protein
MSTSLTSPRLLKGGIVLLDPQTGTVKRILALQYNPDTLTRTFQIRGVGPESGDRLEALRLKGPPVETIKMEAEIDATDQLAANDTRTRQVGLHSLLAALEVLIYPASTTLESNNSTAASGSLEIIAAEAPLTVFVFGPNRIVPVRFTEFSITEEQFDISLNPVRAKLNLTMRVLTVDDLGFSAKGGGLFMTYLQNKEKLAAQAMEGSFGVLGINLIP